LPIYNPFHVTTLYRNGIENNLNIGDPDFPMPPTYRHAPWNFKFSYVKQLTEVEVTRFLVISSTYYFIIYNLI
jgi:hypothetical protein